MRILRATAPAVAAAVAMAACGATPAPPPRVTDYAGIDREFQAAKTGLNLPPGTTWPAHEQKPGPDAGPNPRYEIGGGTVDAQMYWMCSWSAEWLTVHTTDPSRAATAAAELDKVEQSYLYTHGLDQNWQRHLSQAVTGAKAHDPTAVERVVADCAPFLNQA
jgi:hypothetical protein